MLNIKKVLVAGALSLGVVAPAQAEAIVWMMFRDANGAYKPVEARLQRQPMTMFDCRMALDAGAANTLAEQLSDPENHPDLVGWRFTYAECREPTM